MNKSNERTFVSHKEALENYGFSITDELYSIAELAAIEREIAMISQEGNSFLKTADLFAIRQFLLNAQPLKKLIFNKKLKELVKEVGGEDYFLTKAIYFDKPKKSNWFVSYHQDLSISVNEKTEVTGYDKWTQKRGQLGVIPPTDILQNIITLRIHLDDTDQGNGALNIIPESHLKGIIRKEEFDLSCGITCNVKRGGVMLMKPLTMHASGRSNGASNRRVIHLELSNKELREPLEWLEKSVIFAEA